MPTPVHVEYTAQILKEGDQFVAHAMPQPPAVGAVDHGVAASLLDRGDGGKRHLGAVGQPHPHLLDVPAAAPLRLGIADSADLCALSLPANQYRIDHTYAFGSLASTQYYDEAGVALSFKSLDLTIDRNTGLVSESRDSAGLSTLYEYDTMGRLEWEKPELGHESWTQYVYTPATSATALAKVQIRDNRGFLLWAQHPEKGPYGNGAVHYHDYDARGARPPPDRYPARSHLLL